MAGYFLWRFGIEHGAPGLAFTLGGAREALRAALPMGAAVGLGVVTYNFDAVLLGFLAGPTAVGWYTAAYKPVTMALALPVTYYGGLFPALARTYAVGGDAFRQTVARSLRLTSIFAVPLGVGGTFLAGPLIDVLFGPAYLNSVAPLRLLAWSAALVILRGTYRHALNAAGRAGLDVRCAAFATGLNIGLNLLLIPTLGTVGAAAATLAADLCWLALAWDAFCRHVARISLLPFLLQPAAAALAMGVCLFLTRPLFWMARALLAVLVYFGALAALGEPQVRSWLRRGEDRAPV
jgi:O-antigen/teichoic acid export membrane protein